MSFMENVNELSGKETLGRSVIIKPKGRMIKTSKQKRLTIDQFNKCSFNFEQARPIECAEHDSFESAIMPLQVKYCSIVL